MTRRSYCSTSFLPVELKTPSFKTLDYRGAAGGATGTGGGTAHAGLFCNLCVTGP